jgi:hypothetical protein
MMRPWGLWLIVASLIGVTFAWPQEMVAPGPLIPAHAAITRNCFACHAPFGGASAARCMDCHKLVQIGRRTVSGAPMASRARAVGFHQSLIQPDCMACHSDHSEPRLVKAAKPHFAHALLRPDRRNQCDSCHSAPQTAFHAQAGRNCAACHTQDGWKPATFDHARFFALTGPHKAQGQTTCATCHVGGDTSRYTCFGCHQHQPDQTRAQHAEEGIRNIENCVRCHRDGSGEGGERREGGSDD